MTLPEIDVSDRIASQAISNPYAKTIFFERNSERQYLFGI